jgi:hypothetical protein
MLKRSNFLIIQYSGYAQISVIYFKFKGYFSRLLQLKKFHLIQSRLGWIQFHLTHFI